MARRLDRDGLLLAALLFPLSSSMPHEPWPCPHANFTHKHPSLPLQPKFNQHVLEEVVYRKLAAMDLGVGNESSAVLVLSPFVRRCACCYTALCISHKAPSMKAYAQALMSKYCVGQDCRAIVFVVGYAPDKPSVYAPLLGLMAAAPAYFLRKLIILGKDDELPGGGGCCRGGRGGRPMLCRSCRWKC